MPQPLATLRRPSRPRVAAAVLAVALGIGVVGGPAGGDEISDARSEAAQVADRIEELQHDAEVLTERFLDAQLAREQIEEQIADAEDRAGRSGDALAELRTDLRAAAVETYVKGGSGTDALFGATDATDVSLRRGYSRAVTRDDDDLVDAYRGQQRRAEGDRRALDDLLADARQAEDNIAEAQAGTEARIAELRDLEAEVTGRLRDLVEAEQARRDAERERQAREAQARADAEAAAAAAAAPATTTPPAADEPGDDPADEPVDDPAAPAPEAPTTAPPAAPMPAPAPPAPAPAPPASGAEGAIAAARSVLGTRYQWGGTSPSEGFDCSGLVVWSYAQVGRSLPRSSRALYAASRRISTEQLQPGDLVFYNSPVSHVGLYIGGGQMIHSPHTGSVVQIQSIYYWSALVGGGRI